MMKILLAGLIGLVAATTGCDKIDAKFDCRAICNRYSDCFDSKYDVGACQSRCESRADDDEDYRRAADQCDACIDDRACASTVFSCAAECSSVVP